MPLRMKIGLGPEQVVLDVSFRPMSIVAKRSPTSVTAEHLFTLFCGSRSSRTGAPILTYFRAIDAFGSSDETAPQFGGQIPKQPKREVNGYFQDKFAKY